MKNIWMVKDKKKRIKLDNGQTKLIQTWRPLKED
jgi:hypothetical protein